MTAEAVVRGVEADGTVHVELTHGHACRGCEAVCLWRRLPARATMRAPSGVRLESGTAVGVSLPASRVLSGALLLHGLPLAGLLAGASAGFAATGTDFGCLGGAAIGLLAALGAAGGLRRRVEQATLAAVGIRPLG